ncbi:COMM domain-containing protein 6 isoform X1 [Equus przewalskii]|uniref:COMM domain-containing protein 6 n=2 Tax=Equus TaxID=9789 RepID=A0A9L0IYA1_EQUAS|nr:COMM domain-containing protein 6 isoform X1 [Equus caballus]
MVKATTGTAQIHAEGEYAPLLDVWSDRYRQEGWHYLLEAIFGDQLPHTPELLIDFQWKLGMAVSSDSCRSLKYPYVAVMLKVADHSGQVKNKSFEMTIPQFQNFYRQFKEIAAIIETV